MPGKQVLVTGGAGYIGSHTVVEMVAAGFSPVVMDNLSNACPESLKRVEAITGTSIPFYSADLLDKPALQAIFDKHDIEAVVHFAGLKAVGESVAKPLSYYKVNVGGTTNLLEVMLEKGVYNFVFSSSATVYGEPQFLPITESHPAGACINPYGRSKYVIEEILKDLSIAEKDLKVVLLRYFNPIGAHKSGTIGEDPSGIPNNLLPYVSQVAVGRRPELSVYGSDYDTVDGTGVRDYVHVVDLALGHIAALKKLNDISGCKIYNLGTGTGYSVLQVVEAFEKASGKKVPYKIVDRRAGDSASVYADASLAEKELGWKAERGLTEMCEDCWRWQSQNPQGFKKD